MTGKKRWVSRTVRGGKREAERALAALAVEVGRQDAAPTAATVGELLEQWFAHAQADLSPKTVLETRGFIDRNLTPTVGHVPLGKLKTADIDRVYRVLRERGGQTGAGLAPATVRRIHGILHRALEQGVRWGWIAVNPAGAASPPAVHPPELTPPAPADIAALFSLARERDPELAMFVMLAAATGARRSELVALRWSSVDFKTGAVVIRRGMVVGPAGLVEKDTKTHGIRRVALDPTTVAELSSYRRRQLDRASLCQMKVRADGFVFTSTVDGSTCWRPDSTTRAFNRLCQRAGIEGVRLHDLRHYVATRLIASGVDVRTVAGRLGHRNAATTLNVYSHFVAEADRDAANLLGNLFDEAIGENPEPTPSPAS